MSLESTLERIAVALEKLASSSQPLAAAEPAPAPAPKLAAVANTAPAPAPEPVAAVAPKARWASQAEVNTYVMAAYKEMGPEKGAQIGNVLQQIGVKAVTELQPEHYEQFHTAIEALKNA
jgi:hypothetical protein